ncbi:MAG: glycosyltransferase N-terminal domain-containing protein [Paracoccus sp. (in: a-proteobacteria)]|nr:glycosyltransferase N-terminal domain-containing protein [Paracoccus sp. (in: a-proteobacteria)]
MLAGNRLADRLMLDGNPPAPADIWVHGASVGEIRSAATILEALAARADLLVTANSETGRDTARAMGFAAHLAPLDVPQALSRFLDHARPRAAVTLENELWPNRIAMLAARGIPQVVLGARMSARSAARWRYMPGLIRPMLGRITALSAQSQSSEARLLRLGLRADALLPRLQLKLLGPAAITPPPASGSRDKLVLAASTHEGEDAPILDAFLAARRVVPELRLILAPRHPARAGDIATLIAARGLSVARRSEGAEHPAPVLLADTLGEMDHWYRAAQICITGGSLVARGGHTPWEPAAYGCAVLHGPHNANFAEDYALFHAAGAARTIGLDAGAVLTALVREPGQARAMGARGRALLRMRAGDPAPLIGAILEAAGLDPADLAPPPDDSDIERMTDEGSA